MLVPWRDADLFAQRLRQVLQDDALRQSLAARARESVLGYGWGRVADEHLALYAEVLAEPRRAIAAQG